MLRLISDRFVLDARAAGPGVRSALILLVAVCLQGCPGDPLAPLAAPTIVNQPISATVVSGNRADFSVTATGSAPLTYQWQRDGTDIVGATAASYGLPAAQPADSGAVFTVVVANPTGSVTSAAAVLTVLVPPAITVAPASVTVLSGATATFTVAATGSGPLGYQWYVNSFAFPTFGSGTSLSLLTNAGNDGAQVWVEVVNAAGSVTSAHATLTVLVPPAITVQPVSVTKAANATATTFSVTATGSAPLSYQWQANGNDLPGATSATLTVPAVGLLDGTVFHVIVSNAAGSVTSDDATLTLLYAPVITVQPVSQTVVVPTGTFAVVGFDVTAVGSTPLTYQWQRDGTDIPGATSATTLWVATASYNGAVFTVIVSNAAGSVTSAPATLTVLVPPTITVPPASLTVATGAAATFSVTATGSAPLSYQWQRDGTDIAGATAASFGLPAAQAADDGAVFTVVVSNAAGSVTSAGATLTLAISPTITTQPVSQTVLSGTSAGFSVTATGTPPLGYQWQRNGAPIAGATSSTLGFTAGPADNGAAYDVVVSNAAGSVTSTAATLTVLVPPTISVPPAGLIVVSGGSASFSVTASGSTPLSYQWQRNSVDIGGATAAIHTFTATTADDGAQFRVVVSNAAGNVTSAAATLTVTSPASHLAMVAAGGSHSMALADDGTVWAWGGDGFGQLGNGLPMSDNPTPAQATGLTNIIQIASGENHSLALRSDGTVWAWGQNTYGQLGNAGNAPSATPVQVTGLSNVTRIAAGRRHSLAARSDGTVWAWGSNFFGQLGDVSTSDSNVPVMVHIVSGVCVPVAPAVCPTFSDVQQLAGGWTHSLAQTSDLFAWGWGDNFRGEIGGNIGTGGSNDPVQISQLMGRQFLQFAAGGEFSMALRADSTMLAWGGNGNGVLGVSVGASTSTPTLIPTLSGVAQIATGFEHALALKSDGTVWGWGRNDQGQISGNFSSLSAPTQVRFQNGTFLTGALGIGAGVNHTLVVKQDGTVWAFGDDHNCKLGRGCQGTTFSRDPVQVQVPQLF